MTKALIQAETQQLLPLEKIFCLTIVTKFQKKRPINKKDKKILNFQATKTMNKSLMICTESLNWNIKYWDKQSKVKSIEAIILMNSKIKDK